MFIANLIEKHWLYRTFNVITPEGLFEVVYNGHGLGFEEVIVNGEIASRVESYFWYVPKFKFNIGNSPAKIEISVWAWFQIRHFNLEINGESVYDE